MERIFELVDEVRKKYPNDTFFNNFDPSFKNILDVKKHYQTYNEALMALDRESWEILKKKAIDHFRDHRPGQLKQGFFNQLNDALAYQYLTKSGYKNIRILKEGKSKKPDLKFTHKGHEHYCEVKTIGSSRENWKVTGND